MNDKVQNLVLEQLRAIRGDIAKLADEMRGMRTEMLAVRHRARGTDLQQDAHHEDIASMKIRIDRIEKRLELVDEKN